jgi:hypothetical protein
MREIVSCSPNADREAWEREGATLEPSFFINECLRITKKHTQFNFTAAPAPNNNNNNNYYYYY